MAGKKPKKGKAEEPEVEEAAVPEGEEGTPPAKKKMSGKTLILFVVLPAVLVIGGGGAAAMMLLGGKPDEAVAEAGDAGAHGEAVDEHGEKKADKKNAKKDAKKKDDHAAAPAEGEHGEAGAAAEGAVELGVLTIGEEGDPSYYQLPKMIVNLAGNENNRPLVMQLELVLESGDPANFDEMPARMPRLNDQFQTFLRELRVEDLNGSAGSYRLRLELMRRFNLVMAPAKVDAVLIEGILIN